MKRKWISAACVGLILCGSAGTAKAQVSPYHGGIIKVQYSPLGFGRIILPYQYESTSAIKAKAARMSRKGAPLQFFSGFRVSGGYFYNWFQAELGFSGSYLRNQEFNKYLAGTAYEFQVPVRAEMSSMDIKAGFRFWSPGDTSYMWLYLGGRRTLFKSSYNHTRAVGWGIMAGFYGFHGFGLSSGFELVITYDIALGGYLDTTIDSDLPFSRDREINIDPRISLGLGIQYEPYNIALLIKAAPEFFIIRRSNKYTNIAVGSYGCYLGFELVVAIPNVRFNAVRGTR